MATVTVNVQANTGDATNDINKLDGALNQANTSAEDLSDSLEKQEVRIKTLGGAINIVGGSVEVLAGTLAATGALTEEQTERFEAAAVGAIAFADGAKRVFEGYKELKEATKLATEAQIANNLAVLANPYVAVAAALVAVTAGLALYADANSEAAKQRKLLNEIEDAALESAGTQIAQLEILKDRIEDTTLSEEARENALKKLQELIPDLKGKDLDRAGAIDDVTAAIDREIEAILKRATVAAAEERLTEVYKERFQIQQQIAEQEEKQARAAELRANQDIDYTSGFRAGAVDIDIFQNKIDQLNGQLKDSQDEIDFISNLIEDDLATAVGSIAETVDKGKKDTPGLSRDKAIEIFIKPKLIVPESEDTTPTLQEWFASQTIDQIEGPTLRPIIKPDVEEADLGETTLLERAQVLGDKIGEAMSTPAAQGISSNLDAVAGLTGALVQVVDDGSKEAFEKAKKYKIADVVTSSTKAAFDAFAAAQAYGPILGPILGAAQVAAIAVTANRAIQDIRSSTFNDSSVGGGGGTQASAAVAGFTPGGLGGGQQTLVTSIPPTETTPIRAYVVTGDVTDGQAAEAQLQTRRTFGPG